MSRIGNRIILLPKDVSIEISDSNLVVVKGPKGTLQCQVDKDLKIDVSENDISIKRKNDEKCHKACHGLYNALVTNMVIGVSKGYEKKLELVGVGYKASCQGNILELSLGYSHNIFFAIPEEIKVKAEMAKGKNPLVHLEGIDKQLVGQVAAKIRSLRKPEPYKGKGVRYVGEYIRRKVGKTASK